MFEAVNHLNTSIIVDIICFQLTLVFMQGADFILHDEFVGTSQDVFKKKQPEKEHVQQQNAPPRRLLFTHLEIVFVTISSLYQTNKSCS